MLIQIYEIYKNRTFKIEVIDDQIFCAVRKAIGFLLSNTISFSHILKRILRYIGKSF